MSTLSLKFYPKSIRSLLVLVLCLIPIALIGQVTKGSISGTVLDSTNAAIVGAEVKATAVQTGTIHETVSDKSGFFRFNLINPGLYKVAISKGGFKTAQISDVAVGTGLDAGLGSVIMDVAGAQTTVEVSETAAPLIESTQAQVSTSFDTNALAELPGINDNEGLDNLALLVAGAHSARDNGMSNVNGGSGFDVNGIRSRNNDQQIDGQNNNDNSVGGPALMVSDAEFVGEYQIVTNNFGPEYGRNSGSVVNVVTKSGTNKLHGSIYGTDTPSNFITLTNIQKRFDGLTKKPRSNVEFAGFTLGGPIKKDKIFFFEGFDQSIGHWDNVMTTSSLTPTVTGLAQIANCAGVNKKALGALQTYSPFALTSGDPTPLDAADQTFTIDGASSACTAQFSGVYRSLPERQHIFSWLNRVDYTSGKNSIAARYMLSRNNYFNAEDNGPAGWFYNEPSLAQQTKLNWTRQISNNAVNEVAVAYSRENTEFGGGETNSDPAISQLKQAATHISLSKAFGSSGVNAPSIGPATNMPQGRIVNTWQAQDNFNYQLGAHHLKAGVNWTYQRSPNTFLPNVNGNFTFDNYSTFLANEPKTITVANGDPKLDFREYDTFAYVGDDWKISPNLTINLGLTYSLYGQPANLFNDKDKKIQTGSDPLWNPNLDLSVTTFHRLDTDYKSLAPSVGFAWSPTFLGGNGQTVIRGGYRLSFDPPVYNVYLNISSSAPQVFLQTLSSTSTDISGLLPANPTGPNVRSALSSYLTLGVNDPRNYSETNVSDDFRADRVQSWSLGVQRELGKVAVLEARYVGNHGDRLFQSINGNPYLAGLAARFPSEIPSSVTLQSNGRPLANSLVRTRTNTGYSDYHGLQTELRADDLFHQLLFRTNYTWSKTTDNASEIYGTVAGGSTVAFSQNPLNYKGGEHALSGLDVPNSWSLSFVEKIPAFKNQAGLVGHVLGGWAVSGTYFITSGEPYTASQYYFNYITSLYGGFDMIPDANFNSSFASLYDGGLRPFVGNKKAPASSLGVYAGDACIYFGAGCSLSTDTLLDFTDLNTGGSGVTTTKDKVRYIANGAYAQDINKTPWGTASRNQNRDFWTNTGNATFSKLIKLHEGLNASVRATLTNVFNHPNYASVDPIIEDAGDNTYSDGPDGFGDPKLSDGGSRTIVVGATIRW